MAGLPCLCVCGGGWGVPGTGALDGPAGFCVCRSGSGLSRENGPACGMWHTGPAGGQGVWSEGVPPKGARRPQGGGPCTGASVCLSVCVRASESTCMCVYMCVWHVHTSLCGLCGGACVLCVWMCVYMHVHMRSECGRACAHMYAYAHVICALCEYVCMDVWLVCECVCMDGCVCAHTSDMCSM